MFDLRIVKMLCIADSDAVASRWRRSVSETETETEWSFKFFERGKKSHFTENWLATGILESGKEMQYCMSCSACLSTACDVFLLALATRSLVKRTYHWSGY